VLYVEVAVREEVVSALRRDTVDRLDPLVRLGPHLHDRLARPPGPARPPGGADASGHDRAIPRHDEISPPVKFVVDECSSREPDGDPSGRDAVGWAR